MTEWLFCVSVFVVFYIYFGYPIIAAGLGFILNRKIQKRPITPTVTVLIAAYNEEEVIAATVRNKLNQDYPPENLNILVISDCSTDDTDEVVKRFGDLRVQLLRQEPRAGKTSALNLAVPKACGEILVFADANSIYAPDAIRQIAANFADPKIGYVTGRMIYANSDGSTTGDGCSAYMKYENALRKIETRIGSVVGVDGGIDAVRKQLYKRMREDQLPDFILPLKVIEQGYRVVYESSALLKEEALGKSKDEYQMRVRVALRALWALSDMRQMLSLKRFGIFALQLWSHKLLRYTGFLFFLTAYISNLLLWSHEPVYKFIFIIQNFAYLGAICAPLLEKKGYAPGPLKYLTYFFLINSASAHAFLKFIIREKQVMWNPRKG